MKKFVLALLFVAFLQSCAERCGVVVSVYNPTLDCVKDEWVCLDYRAVMDSLRCADNAAIVVLDHSNTQVPYCIVGDTALVFVAKPIEMQATAYYRVVPGVPESIDGSLLCAPCDSVPAKLLVVTLRK